MIFDIWTVLCLLAIVMSIFASVVIKATFNKYNKVQIMCGRTAAQIARDMLDQNGYSYVQVKTPGTLTERFDPSSEVVALPGSVYDKSTIGAIVVATLKVGRAIQYYDADI